VQYVDEYRGRAEALRLAGAIRRLVTKPWTIMEVCGGQTHTIVKNGLGDLLPPAISLVHGPGCPVCVTSTELIDQAISVARLPQVTFCSFGDMLRVPGSDGSLLDAKASGADVRMVYSPLDALRLARANPRREIVFFAVGFETTAPANAETVWLAQREGMRNFSELVAQVLVPPAMKAILESDHCRVQGFLAAGHVCAVMGYWEYEPIAARYRVPIVVTGFEPLDLLEGIYRVVAQLESGRVEVENQYVRVVRRNGNRAAQDRIAEVFEVVPRAWRGLGLIPASGLALRPAYRAFDAAERFGCYPRPATENPICRAGLVLQGILKPQHCPAFGNTCTPETPLGAPMVSSEGACAAYYRYRGGSHE